MDKLKSVFGGHRNSGDVPREEEAAPTTTRSGHDATTTAGTSSALHGQGSHLAGQGNTTSTGAAGSEYHPIYDQFKGEHGTPGTAGASASTATLGNSSHLPNTSSLQHGSTHRPEGLGESASTASIRSGVIGFTPGDHDTHASLGHNPIARELDTHQVQAPGAGSLPDRSVAGEQQGQESSHLGRDAALGAGALGAGGAAGHGLHHQRGDVSEAGTTGHSSSRPLENPTERRAEHSTAEPHHSASESKGHSLNPFHKDHTDKHAGSAPTSQQPSSRVGEQNDSHLGRDAALGAGALGAGGVAAHEHGRHGDDTSRGITGQSSHMGTDGPIGTGVAGGTTRQPDPLTSYGQGDSRSVPSSQQPSTRTGETGGSSHLGRDAAIGAGALGAGGLAGHGLSGRHEDTSRDPTHTSTTQGTVGTDRSFPLAGGVTGARSTDPTTSAYPTSATHDREPGTKEKEVGVHDDHGHGRGALAGAAAAATGAGAGYGLAHHDRQQETVPETSRTGHGLASGGAPISSAPSAGNSDLVSTSEGTLEQHLSGTGPGHEHDHAGRGHNYGGDPCETGEAEPAPSGTIFSEGPHATDTANMLDPHLHIPGEFMNTPAEEASEPSFSRNTGTGPATGTAASLRDTPRSGTTEAGRPRTPENHHGRDAALAGGAGAAGLGALAAGKHHQKDTAQTGGEQYPTESSPYSSKPVDPRLYGASGPPASKHAQSNPSSQLPVASSSTHERDAAMAAGRSGPTSSTGPTVQAASSSQIPSTSGKSTSERDAAMAAGYEPSKHHGGLRENINPSTTQDEQSKHHNGRDAAVAGGLGAAGAGAYAATRDNKDEHSTSHRESEAPASKERDFAHSVSEPQDDELNAATGRPSKIGDTGDPTKAGHFSSEKDVAHNRDINIPLAQGGETAQPTSHSHDGQSKHHHGHDAPADEQSKHHHGRDAATVGGLGAAGAGAYAATRDHQGDPSTSHRDTALPTSQGRDATQSIPQTRDEQPTHHYGRDAAAAGGLGAAGAGAYGATRDHGGDSTGPASGTIGSHQSNVANIVDPRAQPDPSVQRHQGGPTSTSEDPASKTIGPHKTNLANVLDPRVKPDPEKQGSHHNAEPSTTDSIRRDVMPGDRDQHHYGRDAAVVGGTGAAGYGAYEAGKAYDSHRSTQPSAPMNEQRYDPTATGTHDPAERSQHHLGRDAAAAGGLGAAGAGAYGASRGHEGSELHPSSSTGSHVHYPSSDAPRSDFAQQLSHGTPASGTQQTEQLSQHHYGRDAALAGGVGAAGAGAYAATRKDDTPSSSLPQQTYQSPTTTNTTTSTFHQPQHHYSRDAAATGGLGAAGASTHAPSSGNDHTHQPYYEDPSRQHQRYDSTQQPQDQHNKRDAALGAGAGAAAVGAGAYGLSQHNDKEEAERLAARQKDLDHQRKEEQKALEKRQHDQQKALEKEHHKEEKHHDKLVAKEEKKHHDDGGEKKHGLLGFLHRDKTDKTTDPDKTESGAPVDTKHYAGAGAGAAAVGAGAYGVHEARQSHEGRHDLEGDDSDGKRERNRLHKDPPAGHPAREALEHPGTVGGKREHVGIDGPIGEPGLVSGGHTTQAGVYGAHEPDSGDRVIEPITGLPMNVEKYGTGAGGTDGSPTVHGAHGVHGAQQGQGTDWEAIRKANTPY